MSEDPKLSTKYVMVESSASTDKDEIDLLKLILTLLEAWKYILGITILSTGLAVVYAFHLPESFKAETLLAPAQQEKSYSNLNQFGGIAAMVGISIPSSSNLERVLATLETRDFLKKFISNRKLLPIIFEDLWDESSSSWKTIEGQEELTAGDGVPALQGAIEVKQEKSGLLMLSIYWKDPFIAALWANDLVKQLNDQLRQQAIEDSKKRVGYLEQELAKTTLQDMRAVLYNLLESEKQKAMLANVNEDFALEVIDPAVAPVIRDKPNRKLIVVLGVVYGMLLSTFVVILVQIIKKFKLSNSPESSSL